MVLVLDNVRVLGGGGVNSLSEERLLVKFFRSHSSWVWDKSGDNRSEVLSVPF